MRLIIKGWLICLTDTCVHSTVLPTIEKDWADWRNKGHHKPSYILDPSYLFLIIRLTIKIMESLEQTISKITLRKQRRRSHSLSDSRILNSQSNTFTCDSFGSIFNSTLLERPSLSQSLPNNSSTQDKTMIEEMRCRVEKLNNDLCAANIEIDKFTLTKHYAT